MRSFTGTLPQAVRQRLAAFSSFPALAETSRPTRHHAVGSLPPDGPDLLLPLDVLSATRVLYATVPAAMHDYPGHAECAARVPAILAALESSGLTSQPNIVELTGFQRATPADVAPVHNPRYIAGLERASEQAADVSSILVDSAPTYLTQTTYNDALAACGAAMSLVDHVIAATGVKGGRIAGFGICRPPGHHAIPNTAMGFCILNSVAVAARHAQQRLADLTLSSAPKIAIIDWDVHHGNGTQDVFASDPSVLFISMHQAIYPGTGAPHEVGKGEGEGATINVVLPGDAGHCAALQVWDEVIAPAVKRFGADFLLVSAGYDAHWQDPLAGLQFRSTTYHDLSQRAVKLAGEVCHGRLVFLLEGGYHLDALGQSVASTFAGVVGAPPVDALADPGLLRDEPKDKIANALAETKRIHGI